MLIMPALCQIWGGTTSTKRNIISGNTGAGISIAATGSVDYIKGNYIGLDSSGDVGLGNSNFGISSSSNNTVIGGTESGAKNVISDNGTGGISVDGDDTTVIGNLVGTSADGLSVIGNTSVGIKSGGDNVIIGGDSATERNVVAGTIVGGNFGGTGIVLLSFGSGGNGGVVQGNYVGTNINGTVGGGFGNGGFGIFAIGDYSNGLIGGTSSGEGNKVVSSGMSGIAANGFVGFGLYASNISILGNQVYQNTSTGIRLMADTNGDFQPDTPIPFPNDTGDGDTGPNDYLNFPVLNSSSASAGSLDVNFDLDIPDSNSGVTGYRVEFFANDTGDSSGNGEGQIYLGSTDVAGDVTNHPETITLDPGVITTGNYDISATVTEIDGSADGFGATSEFSAFLNDQSIVQPLDNDNDGVNDAVENAGPNGGDGNDDGTLDSEQSSVATILDAESDDYVTLALDPDGDCNQIGDFSSVNESDLSEEDPDYVYPLTLTEFTIPCADSVDGTIYWHGEDEFTSQIYRKFGPTTPGDNSTTSWYTAEQFITSTEDIGGEATATASFTLTDGEVGDDTGNDNVIVDANGPGLDQDSTDSVVDSISSAVSGVLSNTGMNQYGIYVLAGILIAGSSIFVIKRRLFSKTSK